jgi:hypothetical protein
MKSGAQPDKHFSAGDGICQWVSSAASRHKLVRLFVNKQLAGASPAVLAAERQTAMNPARLSSSRTVRGLPTPDWSLLGLNRKVLAARPQRSAMPTGREAKTRAELTWRGLATYYVLFFIQLESRRVALAGITKHPDAAWMEQMARNAVDPDSGHLQNQRYILHDRAAIPWFLLRVRSAAFFLSR